MDPKCHNATRLTDPLSSAAPVTEFSVTMVWLFHILCG